MLPKENGTTIPSKRATIQWMGRAKRTSRSPQRMDFLKGMLPMSRGRMVGEEFRGGAAGLLFHRGHVLALFGGDDLQGGHVNPLAPGEPFGSLGGLAVGAEGDVLRRSQGGQFGVGLLC